MILGPIVDIPRNPWWSRIGETFGEDPLLSGRMAARFVRGAQADRDMAVNLKHYNVYTQETNRRRTPSPQNSVVDERTLQEIYTRPWATAVSEGLASVMCAYNRVNGEHACEHGYLLEQVLRRQLGFDGFVLTDFGASYPHTVDSVEDGFELETGVVLAYGPALLAAVQDGRVSEALLDRRVGNLLRVYSSLESSTARCLRRTSRCPSRSMADCRARPSWKRSRCSRTATRGYRCSDRGRSR